jgi:nucleoside-diphosphate-sugar epimerase
LVGSASARHFARLGWDVIAVSRRKPIEYPGVKFIAVDLLDQSRCREVFTTMSGVTHVVYAALNEKPGLIGGWLDREQMAVNQTMLRNLFEPLSEAARDLEHVTILQGTKAYGAHVGAIPIPARERAPRHRHENFYWLQEDYIRAKNAGARWHFTILRPQVIVGEAVGGNLNVIGPIGVYAAIRRERGLKTLPYPGGPPALFELVDADLLARATEWAATTPACRNETFNITNGDVAVWPELWPAIADALGMEAGTPEKMSLAVEMPKHQADWAAIVRKYNLRAPESLAEFVGESFAFADMTMAYGATLPSTMLVSTIKARQAGFNDCIDSEDMMRKWFRRFEDLRLLPPSR